MTTRRITGPFILPNTPDCDYKNGEQPLTPEKVQQLNDTYQDYAIVDYEHQFTIKSSPYFLTPVGNLIQTWITTKETTFTDVNDQTITTPPGTMWGTVETDDENIIERVDDKILTAFSVSVAEREDAETVMREYNNIATKSGINYEAIDRINKLLSKKRVNISDIDDPVMFTVTLTGLPCVNKAMFCKTSLNNMEDNIMAEKTEPVQNNKEDNMDEETIYQNLKESAKSLLKFNNNNEEQKMDTDKVEEMIDAKIDASNKSITDKIEENNKSLIEAFKSEFDAIREETRKSIEKDEEVDAKPADNIEAPADNEVEEKITDTEDVPKVEKSQHGRGGKSMKHEEKEKPIVNKSAQIPNNYDGVGAGKQYHEKEISERDYLMKFIKGSKTATKSLDGVKISYKGLSIRPEALPTAPAFSLIHPALKDSFTATFTVEGTEKLILPTQQYGLYMRELISVDPLMDDAQFRIDYELSNEERRMYALRYDEDPTQDGIMDEHYYFDNPDLTPAQIEVAKQDLDPVPVRALLHISDRQIRQNVFGENLLTNAMNLVQARYNEGVARINYFSDTTLANTNDIKFRRREGLLKQAGTTLQSDDVANSSGDFDIDDGVYKLFKDMYRALPLEAQKADIYNLYVPPHIYEAYREYYMTQGQGINFIGNITGGIPLEFNKIQVKEAPILADPIGVGLAGDVVSCLLTSPQNTHFLAGRALRIEPERIASTSSTKYWYTGDFDCKFALPEYAVAAQISKSEYEAL